MSLIDNTIFVSVNQFLVYDADVNFEGHVIKNITETNDNDALIINVYVIHTSYELGYYMNVSVISSSN